MIYMKNVSLKELLSKMISKEPKSEMIPDVDFYPRLIDQSWDDRIDNYGGKMEVIKEFVGAWPDQVTIDNEVGSDSFDIYNYLELDDPPPYKITREALRKTINDFLEERNIDRNSEIVFKDYIVNINDLMEHGVHHVIDDTDSLIEFVYEPVTIIHNSQDDLISVGSPYRDLSGFQNLLNKVEDRSFTMAKDVILDDQPHTFTFSFDVNDIPYVIITNEVTEESIAGRFHSSDQNGRWLTFDTQGWNLPYINRPVEGLYPLALLIDAKLSATNFWSRAKEYFEVDEVYDYLSEELHSYRAQAAVLKSFLVEGITDRYTFVKSYLSTWYDDTKLNLSNTLDPFLRIGSKAKNAVHFLSNLWTFNGVNDEGEIDALSLRASGLRSYSGVSPANIAFLKVNWKSVGQNTIMVLSALGYGALQLLKWSLTGLGMVYDKFQRLAVDPVDFKLIDRKGDGSFLGGSRVYTNSAYMMNGEHETLDLNEKTPVEWTETLKPLFLDRRFTWDTPFYRNELTITNFEIDLSGRPLVSYQIVTTLKATTINDSDSEKIRLYNAFGHYEEDVSQLHLGFKVRPFEGDYENYMMKSLFHSWLISSSDSNKAILLKSVDDDPGINDDLLYYPYKGHPEEKRYIPSTWAHLPVKIGGSPYNYGGSYPVDNVTNNDFFNVITGYYTVSGHSSYAWTNRNQFDSYLIGRPDQQSSVPIGIGYLREIWIGELSRYYNEPILTNYATDFDLNLRPSFQLISDQEHINKFNTFMITALVTVAVISASIAIFKGVRNIKIRASSKVIGLERALADKAAKGMDISSDELKTLVKARKRQNLINRLTGGAIKTVSSSDPLSGLPIVDQSAKVVDSLSPELEYLKSLITSV